PRRTIARGLVRRPGAPVWCARPAPPRRGGCPMSTTSALAGKVACITGAGSGLGARTARHLAEAGADIAIHHFGAREQADAVAAACRAVGRRAEVVLADFA